MRFLAGGVATETNVFSPIPTGHADFVGAGPGEPPEAFDVVPFGKSFRSYRCAVEAAGHEYLQSSYCFAVPAGPVSNPVYERLAGVLLGEIEAALPLDGVLLTLHGSMAADGVEDCETDLVRRVRAIVGGAARIGVLLDPHCDLPEALIQAADVVIAFKEYPHTDVDDRAAQLARIVVAAAAGEVEPTSALFDCRMLGIYPTGLEPMRSFVDGVLFGLEAEPRVLAASLAHGFPWADSPAVGTRALVVTDGDATRASALAERVGRSFFALRHEVVLPVVTLDEALDQALAADTSAGPVALADTSDNPGGGAPGDSTFVLRALIERGATGVAIAPLWDPVAVQLAFAAGEGARLSLRLGGKLGRTSGDPLDLVVTVEGLVRDLVQHWPQLEGFANIRTGDAAWLSFAGIDVIAVSIRQQAFGLELFSAFGIDPAERRLLVLKSINHFRAAYDAVTSQVIYASPPGALEGDVRKVPYRLVDTRKFPWVDDPFAGS